ncbi:MAG: glycine cleavage system aminomethyltransferase GcvT [Spirochaetaceae bacterium]|jgi:glycine cleavage system T protein|nr:glycine cleavage system aminomethyltransferase GcvT [Spirochaetaceae bacterium]
MNLTLLHPWHKEAGARFAPFAGYDMPIQYRTGAVEEHRLCRRSAALFDVDHMGQFIVSGPGAGEALSSLVSGAILDMKPGKARYNLLLNEGGGIIDDLFIYRLEESSPNKTWNETPSGEGGGKDPWFVVVNAGNREQDFIWFRERLPRGVSVRDISGETYMISLQGPRAVELLDRLTEKGELVSAIPKFSMGKLTLGGIPVLAGRTGYTGEDGAELYYSADQALSLWELILAEARSGGIELGPAGLAARDSLRFEAGMPLHGHEISAGISPLEALLSWACDFTKEFTGKAALAAQKAAGIKRKLATITVSGGVPREGYRVLNPGGAEIGTVAAGMFCPTTGTYSANVFVAPEYAVTGTKLAVEIRGVPKDAEVVKRPLYVPVYRRS